MPRTKLIIKSLDGEVEYHHGSGQSSRKLSLEDIQILVERYEAADFLTERRGRVLPSTILLLCPSRTCQGYQAWSYMSGLMKGLRLHQSDHRIVSFSMPHMNFQVARKMN